MPSCFAIQYNICPGILPILPLLGESPFKTQRATSKDTEALCSVRRGSDQCTRKTDKTLVRIRVEDVLTASEWSIKRCTFF